MFHLFWVATPWTRQHCFGVWVVGIQKSGRNTQAEHRDVGRCDSLDDFVRNIFVFVFKINTEPSWDRIEHVFGNLILSQLLGTAFIRLCFFFVGFPTWSLVQDFDRLLAEFCPKGFQGDFRSYRPGPWVSNGCSWWITISLASWRRLWCKLIISQAPCLTKALMFINVLRCASLLNGEGF